MSLSQYLFRGGNEAVQTTFELDVVGHDLADTDALTGDVARGGSVRPVGSLPQAKGRLHFRLANIGYAVDRRKAAGECVYLMCPRIGVIKKDKSLM